MLTICTISQVTAGGPFTPWGVLPRSTLSSVFELIKGVIDWRPVFKSGLEKELVAPRRPKDKYSSKKKVFVKVRKEIMLGM